MYVAIERFCSVPGCGGSGKIRLGYCSKHYMRNRAHGSPTGGGTGKKEAQKWLKNAAQYTGDDCLFWPFYRNNEGYAVATHNGRRRSAAMIICEAVNGPQTTPKHESAHRCGNGNKGCLTPRHLRWATRKENMADTIIHGTTNRGERQGLSKLTEKQVLEIRALAGTISQFEIGRIYGVTNGNIHSIIARKTWGWL